jgi:hypothetical protein
MQYFSLDKATSINEWEDGTWIERDAGKVLKGETDENWREFPDIDVLTFISFENTEKVPLIWIDGKTYYYSEAMKELKKLKNQKTPDPIRLENIKIEESHEEAESIVAIA